MLLPAVVLDCGTGYTKMGFAGNVEPSMTIPTAIGVSDCANKPSYRATGLEDLDFHIGHDALANSATYSVSYPVRHGMVDNWDNMERFYQQCIFKYVLAHCLCLLRRRHANIITHSTRLQCMTQMYFTHQLVEHVQLARRQLCCTPCCSECCVPVAFASYKQ